MSNYSRRKPKPPVNVSGDLNIDYKDLALLKVYLSETGKIVPRRITGISSCTQRSLALAVKYARHLALIPFCDDHR